VNVAGGGAREERGVARVGCEGLRDACAGTGVYKLHALEALGLVGVEHARDRREPRGR
jgi:hypothetical protein